MLKKSAFGSEAGTDAVMPSEGSGPSIRTIGARVRFRPNAVERMFCRLKDYRRIATRYDKLAANFLGAIYFAAAVTWWVMSPDPSRLEPK